MLLAGRHNPRPKQEQVSNFARAMKHPCIDFVLNTFFSLGMFYCVFKMQIIRNKMRDIARREYSDGDWGFS